MENRLYKKICYSIFLNVLALLLLTGCSQQDFDRPITKKVSDVLDSGKPYVAVSPESVSLERAKHLAKALANWRMEASAVSTEYHIGPEDIIEINILSLYEPGQTAKLLRTVGFDGNITLPLIGKIKAAGFKVNELEDEIRKAYGEKYLKDPEVTVIISQYRSLPVVVTGAIAKPGVYYLTRDKRTLLEILAEADGLSANAGDELMIIRKGTEDRIPINGTDVVSEVVSLLSSNAINTSETAQEQMTNTVSKTGNLLVINLKKLIDEGDLSFNVPIMGGDMITVLPKQKNYVYVLGYVNRPGAYEYGHDKKAGPMQYVAMAGGLSAIARAENCFLIRETEQGQRIIPFDLTKIARGIRPNFEMAPGDTLVVGSSFLAKLSEFVRPTVGAGVSYSPATP